MRRRVVEERKQDLLHRGVVDTLLVHQDPLTPHAWTAAIGWALAAVVFGLLYFWQGEERYGRG